MALVDPVIIVPGITATSLRDEYPLPHEDVWRVMTKRYERVAMHPDNLGLEAVEPARVRSGQIFEVAYKELVDELRYNLNPSEDLPVPVYAFGYDWRHPLDDIEAALAEFVHEVIDRTKLQPHYYKNGYQKKPRVNLVGHSMGGLIITGYLDTHRMKAPVNKVVTLATPYQGSYEAAIKVITGTANLGTEAPSSRERQTARVTPALYHLLPSFPKAITTPPGLPNTLFDPKVWQSTVVESLAEFIRLRGLPMPERESPRVRLHAAADRFKRMLTVAKKHRTRIDEFDLEEAGLTKKDWLVIVGADAETRVRMTVRKTEFGPQFDLSASDRQNLWKDRRPRKARATGDGTVPLEGALPKFLNEANIVCVTPDDYGYWELQDRILTKVAGFHGILPNMNMLHRMLVRFFTGGADRRGNTWGRPVPGVNEDQWDPPLKLNFCAR